MALLAKEKAFWIALIALGITAAVLLTWYGWQGIEAYELKHAQQRQHASGYAAGDTDQNIAICTHANEGFLAHLACLAKAIDSSRNGQRAHYDLEAQQEMARWAYALLLISIVGLIVSGVGLLFLFWSLRQTQKAIRDSREIGEAQTVAYLASDGVSVEIGERQDDPYRLVITSEWKNAGNTPAFDFGAQYRLIVRKNGNPVIDRMLDANVERGLIRIDPREPAPLFAAPDDISLATYVDDMVAEAIGIEVHVIGSFRNAFKRIVPVESHYRSSRIYNRDAGERGGIHFNIEMAKYQPGET